MAKVMKLTREEAVFVGQLFKIRHELAKLYAEETTHVDRLLTILRGHQSQEAKCNHDGTSFLITRVIKDSMEDVWINKVF